MNTAFLIIIIVAGAWIVLMAGLKGFAALLRGQTEKAARNALYPEDILMITDHASYMGAGFAGPNLPPRTSGALVLTETRLFFLPWFPRKAITLPGNTLRAVETRQTFGGNTWNIPALVLLIKGVDDPDGEMAWLVHDPEGWEREIKSTLIKQKEE